MARILVVDDRPEVVRAIARMLPSHDTVTETDPRRAVARLQAGEQFEMMLIDYEMPGMNGRQVSDALTDAHLIKPPIILIMSGRENVDSLFATGRAVLIKPFDAAELRELVAAVLHEAPLDHHRHA